MSLPISSKCFSASLSQANKLFTKLAIEKSVDFANSDRTSQPYFISQIGIDTLKNSTVEALWPLYATNVSLFTLTLGESTPTGYNPFTHPPERFAPVSVQDLCDSILDVRNITSNEGQGGSVYLLERWLISTFLTLASHSQIGNLTDVSMKFGIPSHIIHNLSRTPLDVQHALINRGYFQLAWRFDSVDFWKSLRITLEKNIEQRRPHPTKDDAVLVDLAIQMFKDF